MLFLLAVVANCRLGRSMDGCAIGFGGAILASWRAMAAASSENASRSVLCTSAYHVGEQYRCDRHCNPEYHEDGRQTTHDEK